MHNLKAGQWIKKIDINSSIYTLHKWYQIHNYSDNIIIIDNYGHKSVIMEHLWDLSNPLDYNPDAGEPINKYNIEKVLKFNGIKDKLIICDECIFYYPDGELLNSDKYTFNNPNWLKILECNMGKLKPLPKKDSSYWIFDYKGNIYKIIACKDPDNTISKYLVDNIGMIINSDSFYPKQFQNKESDFTLLFRNGETTIAKWVE